MEIRIDGQYLEITAQTEEVVVSWLPSTGEALVLAKTGQRVIDRWIVDTGPMVKTEAGQMPEWLTQLLPAIDDGEKYQKWQHARTTAAEFSRAFCGFAIGETVSYRHGTGTFEIVDILTSALAGGYAAKVRRVRGDELGVERTMYLDNIARTK